MRILTTHTLAALGLFSGIACGGTTVQGVGDSGVHDSGAPAEDTGVSRDSATPHADAGAPEQPNDGGIVNDAPPGMCPATYAIAVDAGNCGTTDVFCIYDEGTCTCGEPGPPHEGPSDWYCSPRMAGCPYAPPTEGAACTGEISCDYAACSGGTAWDCMNGTWGQGGIGCPQ